MSAYMITDEQKQKVKHMKEKTGYGMLDCKKSLELFNWDMIEAKELLDEKEKLKELTSLITRR